MRSFYEAWMMLDSNSSAVADELQSADIENIVNSTAMAGETKTSNSTITPVELQDSPINIYKVIQIPEIKDFPVDDFFKVPFTHHLMIIEKENTLEGRYYYIHRTAEEHLQKRTLAQLIKEDAYGHRTFTI